MKAKAKEKTEPIEGEIVSRSNALVPVNGSEPNQLIRLAVEKDLDVEKLKQLMELQERSRTGNGLKENKEIRK